MTLAEQVAFEKVKSLNEIGIALSAEKNIGKLLEKILISAKQFTNADGGTIYLKTPARTLRFALLETTSLKLHIREGSNNNNKLNEIPLYLANGAPNEKHIVSYCANHCRTIEIDDAYKESVFDFSGPKHFDEQMGYRTKSVLAVPMKSHEGEVIGVLQLINASDPGTHQIIPFVEDDIHLVESLASQAAIALTNHKLIADLKALLDAFMRVIAKTIDTKSPFTANHTRRVPVLSDMLARAVNEVSDGPLKGIHFTEDDLYELKVAALLHDCGKITTPEYLIAKQTKLQGVYDGFEPISLRFALLKKEDPSQREYLKGEEEFLRVCNQGTEFLSPESKQRIEKIASTTVEIDGKRVPLLSPDEKERLLVEKGTLTDEERKIVENHVVLTIKMLNELPLPKHLAQVTEIAGSHHERMDGKGYPRGLTKNELSLQARILAVADVFEALSAPDRPYKSIFPLSRVLEIMQKEANSGHLDPDLVDILIKQKVGQNYAKEYLMPSQLDVK